MTDDSKHLHLFATDGQQREFFYRYIGSYDCFHKVRRALYEDYEAIKKPARDNGLAATIMQNNECGELIVTHEFLYNEDSQMYTWEKTNDT